MAVQTKTNDSFQSMDSCAGVLELSLFGEEMLQIQGLGKAFRGEWLFRSLEFQINDRDRIGLVGDNGTGKSTLMKIIAGLAQADEGDVIGARDLTFGYLPQDGLFMRGRVLLEEALSVFESLALMEHEIRQLEHELADMKHEGPGYQKTLDRYSELSQEFRLKDGYSLEAKAGSVLMGLGFNRKTFSAPAKISAADGRCALLWPSSC